MRELTDHIVPGDSANHQLIIEVHDEKGAGGAFHHYFITGFNTKSNPSDPFTERHGVPAEHSTVLFQNGPIKEFGVNGVTHEALLAIVIDRLRCFQAGPFACADNAYALEHVEAALNELQNRTRKRILRGVEGTTQE